MFYQQVIARRYARGLMLSLKTEAFDEVVAELKSFVDLIESSKELKKVFLDPAFSPLDRRDIVNKISERAAMHKYLQVFLLLLIEKNRMSLLPLIYEALLSLVDSHQERVRIKIVSAEALSDQELSEITSSLKKSLNKEVIPELVIDPSLLGGLRIEVGGTVYDGSLKNKLEMIKQKLLSKQ